MSGRDMQTVSRNQMARKRVSDKGIPNGEKADPSSRVSARARILETADNLLYSDGLNTVGVDRLIDEAGVAKASLYRIFGSKDKVIDSYLEARHFKTMRVLDEIKKSDASIACKLNAVFDFLQSLTEAEVFRGCAFVLGAIETSDHESPAWKWAERHKTEVREFFTEIFSSFNDKDLVSTLTEQMMILYDGTLVTAAMMPSSGVVSHGRAIALVMLESALDNNGK